MGSILKPSSGHLIMATVFVLASLFLYSNIVYQPFSQGKDRKCQNCLHSENIEWQTPVTNASLMAQNVPNEEGAEAVSEVGVSAGAQVRGESNGSGKVGKTEDYENMMEKRFATRRRRVQETCQEFKEELEIKIDKAVYSHISYRPKYGLLACTNAKAGSSTIHRHFRDTWKKREIEVLKLFNQKQLKMLLQRPVRFTTVRHPLERLVSAYRHKFMDGDPVTMYSPTGNIRVEYMVAQKLLKTELGEPISLNFTQFLNVVMLDCLNASTRTNWHWNLFYKTCAPCDIDYDYIISMETFSEDLAYVFEKTGVRNRNATQVHRRNTGEIPLANRFESYLRYFKGVPTSVMSTIYDIFKYDFALFGYKLPSDIEASLRAQGVQIL